MEGFRSSKVGYIGLGVLACLVLVTDNRNGSAETAKGAEGAGGAESAPMILVPEGNFTMGASQEEQESVLQFGWPPPFSDRIQVLVQSAGPPHTVYLDAFVIDKYEVTNPAIPGFCGFNRAPASKFLEPSASPQLSGSAGSRRVLG